MREIRRVPGAAIHPQTRGSGPTPAVLSKLRLVPMVVSGLFVLVCRTCRSGVISVGSIETHTTCPGCGTYSRLLPLDRIITPLMIQAALEDR